MILPDYVDESNIDYINNHLKNIAIINLEKILHVNYMDIGIEYKKDIKYLTFQESLRLILTGYYTEPIFEMRLNIYKDDFYLGYYQYLTKLDFTFVDEFFVARW
ncbi:hypothetical protein [Snodgrassella alvi]|uniref:Uncharacterized protein n=1 Tax=Snodgrassella alvi TaxID=1196083 RepID=A0A2N9XZ51_9NEIS|nr:hypothetical protein [Snodgrassella alvi]PIT56276.1 hypothetical protein BHC49_04745 [Snodgrassella alvi]